MNSEALKMAIYDALNRNLDTVLVLVSRYGRSKS